jgi:hypothetical protein
MPRAHLTDAYSTFVAYTFPTSDLDAYMFYVEDGWWDVFNVDLYLTDVPSTVDLAVELYYWEDGAWGLVDTADATGRGGDETVLFGGSGTGDDTGYYGMVLYAVGGVGSCEEPYTLDVDTL